MWSSLSSKNHSEPYHQSRAMEARRRQRVNYIPNDVVAGFLVRLPVKSLAKLTVVCKSWYSIIKSPSFIAAHLNTNLSKSQDPCFLNVYHHLGILLSEKTLAMRAKIELPYIYAEKRILGSCKGLLCLKIIYGVGEGIFLYNPSIQHLKIVESFQGSELSCLPDVVYGLGHDERNNDHRLVKVLGLPRNRVEVYSLRTDSWRELQQSPPRKLLGHCRSNTGLYFNGATHWWTSIEVDDLYHLNSIVAFDFNQEVFRDFTLPSELQDVDMDDFIHMNEFQGSLALFFSKRLHSDGCYIDTELWVMSEYGIPESWNKKFSVRFSDIYKQPIGFTKNGSVVLLRNDYSRSLVVYRLQNRRYEDSKHRMVVKNIFDFTESLLLLDHENVLSKYKRGDNLFYWNLG